MEKDTSRRGIDVLPTVRRHQRSHLLQSNTLRDYGPEVRNAIDHVWSLECLSGRRLLVVLVGNGSIWTPEAPARWRCLHGECHDTDARQFCANDLVKFIAHFIIAILVGLYQDSWPTHTAAAWTSVAFLLFFMLAFGATWGPIPCKSNISERAEIDNVAFTWLSGDNTAYSSLLSTQAYLVTIDIGAMPAEVFPSSIRAKGCAQGTMSNWGNNFIIVSGLAHIASSVR